jgi:hypothetical protein
MSTLTKNLKLIKPELTDAADITAYNENLDKLDQQIQDINDLTVCLPIENGGTGATLPKDARTNLGAQSQITCGTAEPIGGVDGDVYIQIIEE